MNSFSLYLGTRKALYSLVHDYFLNSSLLHCIVCQLWHTLPFWYSLYFISAAHHVFSSFSFVMWWYRYLLARLSASHTTAFFKLSHSSYPFVLLRSSVSDNNLQLLYEKEWKKKLAGRIYKITSRPFIFTFCPLACYVVFVPYDTDCVSKSEKTGENRSWQLCLC